MYRDARLYYITFTLMPGCTTLKKKWCQAVLHYMHRDARMYNITCTEMPQCTTLHVQCCQAVIFVISSDARLNYIISTYNQVLLHYMYSYGRLHYTERNVKNHSPLQSTVFEKNQEKPPECFFFAKNAFMAILGNFSWSFQERCCVEGCGFLRCVQCPKMLNLSYQKQHSEIFSKKNYNRGVPYSQHFANMVSIPTNWKTITVLKVGRQMDSESNQVWYKICSWAKLSQATVLHPMYSEVLRPNSRGQTSSDTVAVAATAD